MKGTAQVRTWTKHTFRCTCGYLCYASQEAIDEYRVDAGIENDVSDGEIGRAFSACLHCASGEEHAGERAGRQASSI